MHAPESAPRVQRWVADSFEDRQCSASQTAADLDAVAWNTAEGTRVATRGRRMRHDGADVSMLPTVHFDVMNAQESQGSEVQAQLVESLHRAPWAIG